MASSRAREAIIARRRREAFGVFEPPQPDGLRAAFRSLARCSRLAWTDPRPLLCTRSARAKERPNDLAAGRSARTRRAALSGLRPRQFELGAQCPRRWRGCAGPGAAPPEVQRNRTCPGPALAG